MTAPAEDREPEPTNRELLAAITSLAQQMSRGFEQVDARLLAAEARFELDDSRHTEITQALEGIAGLVHEQQHEIARSEARLTSRIEDVQRVVQTLKADLAAHASDTQLHHDSHGQTA